MIYRELGARPTARTLTLFAHWDPHNRIDAHVLHYLGALHATGTDIVLVSTCPELDEVSAISAGAYCAGVFTRENVGYDFGSWHHGLVRLGQAGWSLGDFDRLILTNDTVFAPLYPLSEMLDAFTGAQMYGATESRDIGSHLQSFFVVFDLDPAVRVFLHEFWVRDYLHLDKIPGILRYEVGLAEYARGAGLALRAYLSAEQIEALCATSAAAPYLAEIQAFHTARGGHVNPALIFWDVLIEHGRLPLLKHRVYQLPEHTRWPPWHPPEAVPQSQLDYVREVLAAHTDYPVGLLVDYALRTESVRRVGGPVPVDDAVEHVGRG